MNDGTQGTVTPAPAAEPAQQKQPDFDVNSLIKLRVNETRESVTKDFNNKLNDVFGTADLSELKGIAETFKDLQAKKKAGQAPDELMKKLEDLQKLNQQYLSENERLKNETVFKEARSTVSNIVNNLKPLTPAHQKAVVDKFFEDYEIRNNLVYKKGSDVHELLKDGTRAATAEDVINEYKTGIYGSFFDTKSNISHIDNNGRSTDKKNYKPSKDDLVNPRFIEAVRKSGQVEKLYRGQGIIDFSLVEKYMK